MQRSARASLAAAAALVVPLLIAAQSIEEGIGREVAVPRHLADGEEFSRPLAVVLAHGGRLFAAMWTSQEGAGRPLTKGTGDPVSDPGSPLVFPRNFNRVSGPDANSCAGCHNSPHGIIGGSGDITTNVFVLGQRFDAADFDRRDGALTRGAHDEMGDPVDLGTIANSRKTVGMFGSGYLEMLAREITADLRKIRDAIPPGGAADLVSKGISFGTLRRVVDGRWDVYRVEGLPASSLSTWGPNDPPSLIVRPFHQAGAIASLRQFTVNALNHHHGLQATERFGRGRDPDGDGFTNEMLRADITALTLFQAVMAVPGRVVPREPAIEQAVVLGETRFADIGCAGCHMPALPLADARYVEPGPHNPVGTLRPGQAPPLVVDLNGRDLPPPRLAAHGGVTMVPAFTDFKLHDVTAGPNDPNREPLDMIQPVGTLGFFAGNSRFVTRRLWGIGNQGPYFHHGKFTTLREAVLAHAGEAQAVTDSFVALSAYERDCVIEFLKSLQVLQPGSRALVVDEQGLSRPWPPSGAEQESAPAPAGDLSGSEPVTGPQSRRSTEPSRRDRKRSAVPGEQTRRITH